MNLSLGMQVSIRKSFSQKEVLSYTKISNDSNPIHYDKPYASETYFKKPIVPGLLVSSLFGGLLGSDLPGKGTILLGQSLKFLNPVFIDEQVEASITVASIRIDKPIISFDCNCIKENGEIAVSGEVVVIYKGECFI